MDEISTDEGRLLLQAVTHNKDKCLLRSNRLVFTLHRFLNRFLNRVLYESVGYAAFGRVWREGVSWGEGDFAVGGGGEGVLGRVEIGAVFAVEDHVENF